MLWCAFQIRLNDFYNNFYNYNSGCTLVLLVRFRWMEVGFCSRSFEILQQKPNIWNFCGTLWTNFCNQQTARKLMPCFLLTKSNIQIFPFIFWKWRCMSSINQSNRLVLKIIDVVTSLYIVRKWIEKWKITATKCNWSNTRSFWARANQQVTQTPSQDDHVERYFCLQKYHWEVVVSPFFFGNSLFSNFFPIFHS